MTQEASKLITVAGVQFDPRIGELRENCARILERIGEATAQGAKLIVFPECALSGYVFDDLDEARAATERVPGPFTDALAATCKRLGVYVVAGMLEDLATHSTTRRCCAAGGAGGRVSQDAPALPGRGQAGCARPDPYRVYETDIGASGC